jgi:ribosomal protein L44E
MFAKIFSQIFDSSIAENHTHRHVFMDLLVLADSDGVVDMTVEAIARRTNVPLASVQEAITALSTPDPASRTPDEQGRRLLPINESRAWGWQIVNYHHYRAIRDEEKRREYFRDYRRKERESKRPKKTNGKKIRFDPKGSAKVERPHSLHCKCLACSTDPQDREDNPIIYEKKTESF